LLLKEYDQMEKESNNLDSYIDALEKKNKTWVWTIRTKTRT
jgi:hypothetical protein